MVEGVALSMRSIVFIDNLAMWGCSVKVCLVVFLFLVWVFCRPQFLHLYRCLL